MSLNKDQMNPEDLRNLVTFIILVTGIYLLYDHFVQRPQMQAVKERRAAQEQILEIARTQNDPELLQPKSRQEIIKEEEQNLQRIAINSTKIKGSISLQGAHIDDISFKDYFDTLAKENNVVVLSPKGSDFPRYIEYGWVASDESISLPKSTTRWKVKGNTELSEDSPVTLRWNNGQGLIFEREISIDNNYMFSIQQRVINTAQKKIDLYPYGLVTQKGPPPGLQQRFILHEGPIGYVGEELEEISYKKLKKDPSKVKKATQGWIGITDKYWLTSLIPQQNQNTKFSFQYVPSHIPGAKGKYQTDFLASKKTLEPGQTISYTSQLFTGAKKVLMLKNYEKEFNIPRFDLAVDFGIFWFMTVPFFYALHYVGDFIGNLGIAIIVLTLFIRMAVFPLTSTSYRSFAKMKKVSPQIMELRERYGDDKVMLQQELMKMYEREGVNPMAGCLPILVQIPIFFAFYKVLFVTIEVRHAPFFGWIEDLSAKDPTSLFNGFGLLPYSVPEFLMIGVWPCIMLVAMIIQKRLNPPPQDKLQRDMMNYFPFIITFILAQFASGLVIYWTVSALLSILQQMYIMRSLGVPIHLLGESEEEEKKPSEDKNAENNAKKDELSEPEEKTAQEQKDDDSSKSEKAISAPKRKKKKKKK